MVTRSVANTIDALVVGVMVGAVYLGLVSVKFLLDPRNFTWPDGHFLAGPDLHARPRGRLPLAVAGGCSVAATASTSWASGSPGRRGRKLGPVRALGRAAFCVFFPIGFFWCLISPRRHSVQDIAVYSSVTYDWRPQPDQSSPEAPVAPAGATDPPASGAAATEPDATDSPVPTRRYRWARAVDPYDD